MKLRYFIILAIISLSFAETFPQNGREKKVIQSDHFSSTVNNTVSYQIENVQIDKPFILILKKR